MPDKVLVHNIARPVHEVYPYFCNMEQFVSIHPVIFKCDLLTANCYRLHERLKIPLIGFNFSYRAAIERAVEDTQVIMFAEIRKGITLRLVFDFTDTGNHTMITETITFNGPFFIKPVFIPFLAKTHQRMMGNINNLKRN